ncbi:MAG: helix-turn-helix domain-containing protein [Puniceicoccaceae bacterium]
MNDHPHNEFLAVTCTLRDIFGFRADQLQARTRVREIAWPRQIGMALLQDQFGWHSKDAALAFCRNHHTTALHALRTVRDHTRTDHRTRREIALVLRKLATYRSSKGEA